MSSTLGLPGRFGNKIIINLCMHFIAKKNDLHIEYDYFKECNELGLDLYCGKGIYSDTLFIDDNNLLYFVIQNENINSNIRVKLYNYFQTKEICNYLFNYLNMEDSKKNIIKNNKFYERYNNNNDVFIHIRLDDAEKFNPGNQYYYKAINNIKNFDKIYISSDTIDHEICNNLIATYNAIPINYNEVDTIHFGSTCKNIILSHGSFSAIIGYLGFFSNIYYPEYEKDKMWYGDMFSIPGWNSIVKKNKINIITGEKFQQLCDVYLGYDEDLNYNPLIKNQTSKHFLIDNIKYVYDNPYKVFCYSHLIPILSQKIHYFQNNFILISHNSDGQIMPTHEVLSILNCEKLVKWYGQNICFQHDKLYFLPIGIANSMWSHGNLSLFNDQGFMNTINNKTRKVYFNFKIATNIDKRQICYDSLKDKLEWIQDVEPLNNFVRLKDFEFCVCPEGNGVDTHRLWECFYLKVVPIVIKSPFTNILINQGLPIYILENWGDLDINKLNYADFNFDSINLVKLLDFTNYFY